PVTGVNESTGWGCAGHGGHHVLTFASRHPDGIADSTAPKWDARPAARGTSQAGWPGRSPAPHGSARATRPARARRVISVARAAVQGPTAVTYLVIADFC